MPVQVPGNKRARRIITDINSSQSSLACCSECGQSTWLPLEEPSGSRLEYLMPGNYYCSASSLPWQVYREFSSFSSAVTLLSPHTCRSIWTLSFATQSPVKAPATAMGKEAFPASVSEPLVAGRSVSDVKISFLTALVSHYLFFCPQDFAGLNGALFTVCGLLGAFLLGMYVDRTRKFIESTKISFCLSALASIMFAVVSSPLHCAIPMGLFLLPYDKSST